MHLLEPAIITIVACFPFGYVLYLFSGKAIIRDGSPINIKDTPAMFWMMVLVMIAMGSFLAFGAASIWASVLDFHFPGQIPVR